MSKKLTVELINSINHYFKNGYNEKDYAKNWVEIVADQRQLFLPGILIVASHNIVERLLEAGANVNLQANDGWTALMWAAERGHTEIVELLINAEAIE